MMANLVELKKRVQEAVEGLRESLYEIASWLYENPELGSEEFKAVELLTGELEKQGFRVEHELLEMPTAFCATYKGRGYGPRVAVLAEYEPSQGSATAVATTSSRPPRSARGSPSARPSASWTERSRWSGPPPRRGMVQAQGAR